MHPEMLSCEMGKIFLIYPKKILDILLILPHIETRAMIIIV